MLLVLLYCIIVVWRLKIIFGGCGHWVERRKKFRQRSNGLKNFYRTLEIRHVDVSLLFKLKLVFHFLVRLCPMGPKLSVPPLIWCADSKYVFEFAWGCWEVGVTWKIIYFSRNLDVVSRGCGRFWWKLAVRSSPELGTTPCAICFDVWRRHHH